MLLKLSLSSCYLSQSVKLHLSFYLQADILRNTFLFVITRSKSRYLRPCVDLLPCKKGNEVRVGQRTNRGVGTELKTGNFRDCVDH